MIGSRQSQCKQQNQEPTFFVDLLRKRISTLQRELVEKNTLTDFLLKERNKHVSHKKTDPALQRCS